MKFAGFSRLSVQRRLAFQEKESVGKRFRTAPCSCRSCNRGQHAVYAKQHATATCNTDAMLKSLVTELCSGNELLPLLRARIFRCGPREDCCGPVRLMQVVCAVLHCTYPITVL